MVCGQATLSLVNLEREGLGTGIIHSDVDKDPRRWTMLAVVSFGMLLSLTSWMTATAIGPELQLKWSLSSNQLGWLTTIVQLGFVIGTALGAILNLADVLPSRAYFALSAFLAAASNAILLTADGFNEALPARFLTGFFLAGVYPPGMKMVSTWFQSARGLAIGTVVGALTVGKATPYLLKAVGGTDTISVIAGGSVAGLFATLLISTAYRDGPYPFPSRAFEWSRVGKLLRHKETMLATGGYLGHMWELYAMWTWISAFLFAAAAGAVSDTIIDLVVFGTIAAGALGCVWGGVAADRIGRHRVVNLAMAISGGCCLSVGVLFQAPFVFLVGLTWVWGFFVVADSAQFSALVTEVAPQDSVGTALMLQTSLGFLVTMVTIQAVPAIVGALGWQWAFAFLAAGPVCGICSILLLERSQRVYCVQEPMGN